MADKFITQNKIVGFKSETTAGVYNAPLAVDFDVLVHEISNADIDYHMNRLGKPATGNLVNSQSHSGMRSVSITGKTELKYSGDETVAPKDSKLVSVCGLQVGGGGASAITYTYQGIATCETLSAIVTNLNCGTSPDGISKKVSGIQGNLVISAGGIGQEIVQEFTLSGADAGEVDNATPIKVLQGIDTGVTERFLGTVFTIGAQAFKVNSFSLDLACTVSLVGDPSRSDNGGIAQFMITATDCKLTVQVQKIDLATSGLSSDIINNTVFSTVKFTGVHWDIDITESNLSSRKDADGNGLIMEDLEFEVRGFVMTQKD